MKTTITILLVMFVWTMMPIEAMAARGDRHDRQPTAYSNHNNYDRHGERHDIKREHRSQHRQSRHQRIEHRYPASPVRYVTPPRYRTVVIPSRFLYSATPGVSFYFGW